MARQRVSELEQVPILSALPVIVFDRLID
jgi:hypothetical protein